MSSKTKVRGRPPIHPDKENDQNLADIQHDVTTETSALSNLELDSEILNDEEIIEKENTPSPAIEDPNESNLEEQSEKQKGKIPKSNDEKPKKLKTHIKSSATTGIRFRNNQISNKIEAPPAEVKHGNSTKPTNYIILLFLLALVFITCAANVMIEKYTGDNYSSRSRELIVNCSNYFKELRKIYPNQDDDLWKTLSIGVRSVLKNQPTPTVFVLLYNDTNTSNDLVYKIIDATKSCLDTDVDPVILSSDNFNTPEMIKDYGVAIKVFGPKLKNSAIMLVNDIQKVSPKVAEAFHVFCDLYNPLVKKAVIYFTLFYNNHPLSENINDFANEILLETWIPPMSQNRADPLIARITDQVLLLKSEK